METAEQQLRPEIATAGDLTAWNLVPFLISDAATGRILQANPLVVQITGYSHEELRQLTVLDLGLWPSAPERRAALAATPIANPSDWVKLRRADGSRVDVMHGWQTASFSGREVVSEVMVDMSLTARTQERLERLGRFRQVLSDVLSDSLRQGLDDGFYQRVLQSAVEIIPGAQIASLLVREDDGMYRFKAAVGCDLQVLQQVSFTEEQMELSPSAQPFLHHGYADNSDLTADMRDLINASGPTSDIKVSIVAPVLLGTEPVAVFNLDNLEDPAAFDEEALTMARDFAQHLAVLLQRFRLEEALWTQAHFDKLTGLPNRRRLDELLPKLLAEGAERSEPVALYFLDLDNFKTVNDTFGHAFGDNLVKALTERLVSLLPDDAVLARWGGDELVAVVPGIGSAANAEALAARLIGSAELPYGVDGVETHAMLSIGLAMFPESGTTPQVLMQNADTALYRAKQEGRSTFRTFDLRMREELALQNDIRRAVVQDEISLYFQPRFDTAGRLVTMEALARWQHPERGVLPAAAFIGLAEEAGLMQQLGLRLLDRALLQARAWLDQGLHAPVAFNLSVSQLASPLIAQQVGAALRRHALPADLLELQIAETSAVTEVPDAALKMLHLRRLGVRLLLDEIGSGLSSLAMLRRFHLDGIRISREYVGELSSGPAETESELGAADIIRALVSLGRDLNVQVVAEGVENQSQLEFVIAAGATQVQGFLFSDALPPELATAFIRSRGSAD